MTKRLPFVSTLLVLASVALMVGLGVWQLQRAKWKEGILAQYAAAERMPPIAFPTTPLRNDQLPLFRYATGLCLRPVADRAVAGENKAGETGYVQIFDCATGAEGPGMSVELGWSRDPNAQFDWDGGIVSGIIVPDRQSRMRLVAATAPAGLQPSKVPDVASISPITPGVHRGYAATWFSLAVVALVIYILALRKRRREEPK
ncbi:MAG TPA: SURF1 family cytochrome oxidase biogenesis protein [Sphingomicrobium sp.]|nr:SURF1 family cytochrome oxidase biogenesis protein [Sphingomicrobium sp.]